MIITKKLLEKYNACEDGIKFFENNFKELDTNKIEVTGDYNNFYSWVRDLPEIKVDDKGNIIWEKFPNNNIFEYKYDKNHNLIWKKLPNGNIYEWKYDENNNLILKKYLDDHIHEYQYDHNDNIIWQKNSSGNIIEFKYDKNNNLIWEKIQMVILLNTNMIKLII